MKHKMQLPEELRLKVIADGELLLKFFHDSYADNPVGTGTENMRGQFTQWKRTVVMLYGESEGEDIILGLGESLGLTIPHCGPLAEDGSGDYIGWDSFCHTGPVGKLNSSEAS